MNLYLLYRTGPVSYDQTRSMVVVAGSYGAARQMAYQHLGRDQRDLWMDDDHVTVTLIAENVIKPDRFKNGLVCEDVKEG